MDQNNNIISNQGIIENRPGKYKIHKHRKLVSNNNVDSKNYNNVKLKRKSRQGGCSSQNDRYSDVFFKVMQDKKGSTPSGRSRLIPGALKLNKNLNRDLIRNRQMSLPEFDGDFISMP